MSGDEWANLRPAIREAELVDDLIRSARDQYGTVPDWLAGASPGVTPSLENVISLCREKCRNGDPSAAVLLGRVVELSKPMLGDLNDATLAAIVDLVGLLGHPTHDARVAAIEAITKYGMSTSLKAVEAVAKQIEDACPAVQLAAVQAISHFGADKSTLALTNLSRIVRKGVVDDVRRAACRVLEGMGADARSVIGVLVQASVAQTDTAIARDAARALARIDPDGVMVGAHLPDADTRDRLVNVLREVGEPARVLRQKIQSDLMDVVREFRTLKQISDESGVSLTRLGQRVRDIGVVRSNGSFSFTSEQWAALGEFRRRRA